MFAMRIFEKLVKASFWVVVIALVVMVLLALLKPTKDTPEDES